MSLKKIALFTDGITPYVIGGMQKHSYYVAKYLAMRGIQVDLYHFSASASHDIQSLDCFTVEEKKNIRSFVFEFKDEGRLPGHYLRASYAYSKEVFQTFMKHQDVDFVYVKGFTGWKFFEEKKNGMKLPPAGVKFHGMNMYEKPYSFRSRLEQLMLRPAAQFSMDQADIVFSYGGKVTKLIHEKAKIPFKKILEIPTGIERSWVTDVSVPAHKPRNFLFVGRYDRLKGMQELNTVIKKLLPENLFTFHFVGPVPDAERISNTKIVYHGMISHQAKMKELMQECDVLVCPSYSEGMPNVILEAMSQGLAIIGSDIGAIPVMVDEANGMLIRPGNEMDLEMAMRNLLTCGSEKLEAMKVASLKRIKERFLWDGVADLLIDKLSERISLNRT